MLEEGEGPRESGWIQGFPEAIKLFTVLPLTFTPLLEHTVVSPPYQHPVSQASLQDEDFIWRKQLQKGYV